MANAKRDDNRVTTLLGVSDIDGSSPVVIYADPSTHELFVKENLGLSTPTVDSYQHIAINLNAGANQVLVSSAANKQIWVYGVAFTLSVAGTVSFQDEDDTAVTGIMDFAGNSGISAAPSGSFSMPIWKLATNKDLEVDIVTASIDGWLDYSIVDVTP